MYFRSRFVDVNPQNVVLTQNIVECLNLAIDQNTAINNVKLFDNRIFIDDYYLVSIGKNALNYSNAIGNQYPNTLLKSFVLQVKGYYEEIDSHSSKQKIWWVDHPLPTLENLDATTDVINDLSGLNKNKKVIFIITGGSSASLFLPETALDVANYIRIINYYLSNNFSIDEINQIRSVIDATKGGKLLDLINNKNNYSIIISDVSSDDPRIVGSGPTVGGIPISMKIKTSLISLSNKMGMANIVSDLIVLYENHLSKQNTDSSTYQIISNSNFLRSLADNISNRFLDYSIENKVFDSEFSIKDFLSFLDSQSKIVISKKIIIGIGEILPDFQIDQLGKFEGGRVSSMLMSILNRVSLPDNVSVYGFATDGKDGYSRDAGAHFHYKNRKRLLHELHNLNYDPILNSGRFFYETKLSLRTDPTHINFMDVIIIIWN